MEGLVGICEEILRKMVCRVRVAQREEKQFWVGKGLGQGCPLSPGIFT